MSCGCSWYFGMAIQRQILFLTTSGMNSRRSLAELADLRRQPRVGYLVLTMRYIRHGLNAQTFRLAIHLNLFWRRLCCAMRNRRRALRSSHSPPDSNLAVFLDKTIRQKHLTHLSRVISLPNHDVCLEHSRTLYEFG